MFEGNLYIVESKEVAPEGETKFTLSLIPASPIYRGHFPDCPITPGVCLLSIVRELTESLRGEKMSLKTVKEAKYVRVVTPEAGQIEVYIAVDGKKKDIEDDRSENKDENKNAIIEVKAEIKSGENLCAKFKLQYERSAAA